MPKKKYVKCEFCGHEEFYRYFETADLIKVVDNKAQAIEVLADAELGTTERDIVCAECGVELGSS